MARYAKAISAEILLSDRIWFVQSSSSKNGVSLEILDILLFRNSKINSSNFSHIDCSIDLMSSDEQIDIACRGSVCGFDSKIILEIS
jgi:hypothetical protein